ncbi:TonB-dependent receptor [Dyadobacter diqingensis]|uniref:TonB-dependent receptor n=1 Tax=Dyadobacter diqingensis TaxID=2938121 RepID=UPI0020C1A294|nr:TonB-dependent receptor [Dyadobacter diqingensis]
MIKRLLLNVIFFTVLFLNAESGFCQRLKISGSVTNSETGEPVPGAAVVIKGKLNGTITDKEGDFELITALSFPFLITISSVGYKTRDAEITSGNLMVVLQPDSMWMNEVVISASRVEEHVLQSPVSVEKMNSRDIQTTPSLNFYDGLQNLKGVELTTVGLTNKQVNTRGFNSISNSRFLQLIDGVDNQPPGLNVPVGNLFGSSELDLESVEVIPGSASALYGPVAFNGLLMMRTKNPFLYTGLSVQLKSGLNHINEKYSDPHGLYDFSLRYARVLNRKLALKVNASYFKGLDWFATNYTDVDALTPANQKGENNPARNALNIYGDEVVKNLEGIGRVSRTGYEERDLMNYNTNSLKLNGALHYRANDNMEFVYQYNYGQSTAAHMGSSRFSLNNYALHQHRVELKGRKYFVRAYAVMENSHDTYNARTLGQNINLTWVKDLNGIVVAPARANNTWFDRYAAAFKGNVLNVSAGNHTVARAFADEGRYLPGSGDFNREKEKLEKVYGAGGAGIFTKSKFYHAEGQYDFTDQIKFVDIVAGGNFRRYDMFTNGTLFDDKDQNITINEGGAFVQVSKKMWQDKLKLTVSDRFDKNQNFKGRMTPRASAVFTVAKNHNFRISYQTGFRNPIPVDQYIKLTSGTVTVLGGVPANSRGMNVYENSFTYTSVNIFSAAVNNAVQAGSIAVDAISRNKDLLVKSNIAYVKPERDRTFEIGYKSLVANNLLIDVNYYYSAYKDFILSSRVVRPQSDVLTESASVNAGAATEVFNGQVQTFILTTNASDKVATQGATLGLTYQLPKNYTIGGNGTWSSFNLKKANPGNVPAFNTPKFRTNVLFGNQAVYKNMGFNVAWHWQDTFDWYGAFNEMRPGKIKAFSTVDAQVSCKFSTIKSTVKVGANNLLNRQVYQAYGSASIGAIYYVSLTFDEMLR